MKRTLAILLLFAVLTVCAPPAPAADVRLDPLKDLDGYFPFQPPATRAAWETRRECVRRRVLVSTGLWPMPTRTPLRPTLYGRIDRGEYTVEKGRFESAPGFFVTGNLYRPKGVTGKVPGVLFAHGHRKDARLSLMEPDRLRATIAAGEERFEQGGRSSFQSMCVQLARMGCVVWQWDMLGDSDSIQLSRQLVHGFARQRPEMNTTENWGLFSPQAEAHAQNVMGLQTWNSVRSLDFILSLPEVDPARVAVTGASGGGTQTMILAAIDDRLALSFPVVMVSTSMQGGCTCENASLLRVGTGNVEFAALFAPKPQGMNTADDWTRELALKGFPDLERLYAMLGARGNVFLERGEHFPHNYNAVTRSAFYTFLNKHFKLGRPAPVIERDYEPLSPSQLTVWDSEHPAPPAADPGFERQLLQWFTQDAARQLHAFAATRDGIETVIRPAVQTVIGRGFDGAGDVEWQAGTRRALDGRVEISGTLINQTHGEEVAVVRLEPAHPDGRVIVWLGDGGRSTLRDPAGGLRPAVAALLRAGATVLGADLFFQGGAPVTKTRVVNNPREFAGYTLGYNHALFAQRVHDTLTIVSFLRRSQPGSQGAPTTMIGVVGWGAAGPIVTAARAVAGAAIDRAAVDTGGFRFGRLLDWRDPLFLPGGAKYLDLPGMIALNAPHAFWVAGEGAEPEIAKAAYRLAARPENLAVFTGETATEEPAAVEWLLKKQEIGDRR